MALVVALALHVAAVGLIGLGVIVLATAFTGVTQEHRIGHAFQEALPFTALLGVFFGIVAVIHDQHLFAPRRALRADAAAGRAAGHVLRGERPALVDQRQRVRRDGLHQPGVRSARARRDRRASSSIVLAVAINTGTNIPSVATPNGQAAFLFLLTSSLAPLLGCRTCAWW